MGAGIAAAGGLLGQLLSGASRDEANRILMSVRDAYGRIDPAKVKQMAVEKLGPSALEGLQAGPEYAAMGDSLNRLGQEVQAGGMGIQDRAAMNEALDTVGQQERAQREGIMDRFNARGAGGSSQNLLAQLVAQQGGAQRAQRAGMDAAGNAQARYWDAVRQRAQLGSSMLGHREKAAEAKDAINRWNAANRQDTARYNNSLEQQRFSNDLARVQGQAGASGALANQQNANADRTQQTFADYGKGFKDAFLESRRRRQNPYSTDIAQTDEPDWSY
jgi:hypothetical protein